MAPARMVEFMTKHIAKCEVCIEDPDIKEETQKIRNIVLPPSKIPKPAEPDVEDSGEEDAPEEKADYLYADDQDEDSDSDENDMIEEE